MEIGYLAYSFILDCGFILEARTGETKKWEMSTLR